MSVHHGSELLDIYYRIYLEEQNISNVIPILSRIPTNRVAFARYLGMI